MIISQIQSTLPYNIKTVWTAVTDIKNYHWRSDLSHTEVLNKYQFTEYAKNGARQPILQQLFLNRIPVGNLHLKTAASAAAGAEFFLNRELLPLYTLPKKLPSKSFI